MGARQTAVSGPGLVLSSTNQGPCSGGGVTALAGGVLAA